MFKLWLQIILIFGLAGCGLRPHLERNRTVNPDIRYFTNQSDDTLPLELVILKDGISILMVQTNRDNTEIPNAGVFQTHLNESQLAPLIEALRRREFTQIQSPESMYPGEVFRELSIKEEGREEITKTVSESVPDTPAFLAPEKLALELTAIVRKKPLYAIMLQVTQVPSQFIRGESVQLAINLVNIGSQQIKIPHPQSWSDQAVQLQLGGIRSDVPTADLQPDHQKFEELSEENIQEFRAKNVAVPLLSVVSGEQITLLLQKKLDWPPGQYDVNFSYLSPLFNLEGEKVIVCEVISKNLTMKCLGE